ncbi:hypothetical protein FOCC_FOCC000145 [Frankliniella occidentalis]|nr:hypothetical protein FOCC_FOCC000145 [Frankliniella occidentalis]
MGSGRSSLERELCRPPSAPHGQPHGQPPPGLTPSSTATPFSLPFPFPHPAAAAAFLPPPGATPSSTPGAAANPQHRHSASSASSHSSESSTSSQQTWSFEEQFKQVRQVSNELTSSVSPSPSSLSNGVVGGVSLSSRIGADIISLYEINDDPKRKEFLDDLFSFMQKRGE